MNPKPVPIVRLRKATEADVPFIFNAWLSSYRKSYFAKDMHNTIYYSEQHKIIENLLRTCETWVACSDIDPTQIFGFICSEFIDKQFVLHYAYVKQGFRFLGIGTMLLKQTQHDISKAGFYSHHTQAAHKLAAKYRLIYSVYLALSCEYRTPLPAKATFENVPEDAFVEKPEDMK